MLSQSRSLELFIVQSISYLNVTLLFGLGWTILKNIVVRVNLIENSQVFNSKFSVLSTVQNGKL